MSQTLPHCFPTDISDAEASTGFKHHILALLDFIGPAGDQIEIVAKKLSEADIVLMFKKKTLPVLCSFCGKTAEEARKLIAGPGVHICADCAADCYQMLGGEPTPARGERKHKSFLRLRCQTNG